jgi:hypothetical protein
MKQEWENSQAKTFAKWINSKIAKAPSPEEPLEKVFDVLSDLRRKGPCKASLCPLWARPQARAEAPEHLT